MSGIRIPAQDETHWMIDIETLGQKPGCSIISFAAVPFRRHGVTRHPPIQVIVSRKSCADAGLLEEDETLEWWESQPAELKEPRLRPSKGVAVALPVALLDLYARISEADYVWSHGLSFDIPILEVAFVKCGMRSMIPWSFRNLRDTCTIYDLTGEAPDKKSGVEHDEVSDAIRQIEAVVRAWDVLESASLRPE